MISTNQMSVRNCQLLSFYRGAQIPNVRFGEQRATFFGSVTDVPQFILQNRAYAASIYLV